MDLCNGGLAAVHCMVQYFYTVAYSPDVDVDDPRRLLTLRECLPDTTLDAHFFTYRRELEPRSLICLLPNEQYHLAQVLIYLDRGSTTY